jgi:hypothetical protein
VRKKILKQALKEVICIFITDRYDTFLSFFYDISRPMKLLIMCAGVFVLFAQYIVYGNQFTDVEGHQYRTAIEFLAQREIVKGYPDGTYGVDRTITRAELLKIVLESTVGDQLVP